ncbi:non-homologous end joining protein Ku [Gilvimarinus sp. F26214L]|uniref:non-homologous end joining protein Ku n=1 Tax=Gilvimarinus sp. DZF01 TaxID=3461371 RepID=UPI00404609C7
MAARAMWKAVLHVGDARIPVKLYSALQDRSVHFRLLHARDHAPVRQHMVNPETDEIVPYDNVRRGYVTPEGDLVMLSQDELDQLEPDASRDIEVLHFFPGSAIDHRWYRRPYYLGPDGSVGKYAALVRALEDSGREGLARWTMRKKAYVGALRLHQGYPMLMALRSAEEVISLESIETPSGAELDDRELNMAQQLIDMLAADFTPEEYTDEYRERVVELIQTKASGGKVATFRPRRKPAPSEDLSKALQASLDMEKKRA